MTITEINNSVEAEKIREKNEFKKDIKIAFYQANFQNSKPDDARKYLDSIFKSLDAESEEERPEDIDAKIFASLKAWDVNFQKGGR